MIQFTVQLFHPIFSDNTFSRVFQNLLFRQETEDQIFLPWSQKAMAAPAESHHLRSQLTFTKATLHAEHDAVNITSVSKTWRKFRVDHREFLEAGAATRTSYIATYPIKRCSTSRGPTNPFFCRQVLMRFPHAREESFIFLNV